MGRSVKVQKELKKKIRTEYKRRLELKKIERLDEELEDDLEKIDVLYFNEPEKEQGTNPKEQ